MNDVNNSINIINNITTNVCLNQATTFLETLMTKFSFSTRKETRATEDILTFYEQEISSHN